MEETIKEVNMALLKNVKELEILHNVDIQNDAVDLACSIVGRYYEVIMVKLGNTHSSVPEAQEMACWLLEKASLELKVDEPTDLKCLLREGYLIFRNLVELSEFGKDKASSGDRSYLSHLEKENENLKHSWNEAVENCNSVLAWQKNPQRIAQLVKLRECVCHILNSQTSDDKSIHKLHEICTLIDEYRRSIPATVMQYRTVSPLMVAKIASPLTGVPISWLLNSFRPQVACLRERLSRKVIGQDLSIQRIANIICRRLSTGNGLSPLASFLFIPFSWIRIEELFESLAEELYDSKDRLVWFNLDMHENGSSSSDVDIGKCRGKWDAIQQKITEVVKSNPFCALLFENVGTCEYATAFLENILKHGKLVDKEGRTYDLSNTLIVMTSLFGGGKKERQALNCSCKYIETDCAMVEDARMEISFNNLDSERLLHRTVLGSLWGIHELVDGVLVLNPFPPLECKVIIRLCLRDEFDGSSDKRQLILYPSEAAVRSIFCKYVEAMHEEGVESCLKRAILPVICRGIKRLQTHNMATIHMDVLFGSMKFAYRPFEVGSALEAFRESLTQWKTLYKYGKKSAKKIVKLSASCSRLVSLIENTNEPNEVTKWLKDMENIVDGLISSQVNSSNFLCAENLVPPKMEAKFAYRVTNYSYSNVQCSRSMLSSALREKYALLNFIASAISSPGSDEALHCHPKSFLFLGLRDNAKAHLLNVLSHLFESEDTSESIIQLNMEKYRDSDSLMQFVDCLVAFALPGTPGTESSLSDCGRTSCRVLLIDRVGEAHISVFSALLSLLDRGVLTSREGKLVDFCRTVIIITSNIGNKDILAGLTGHAMGTVVREENDQRTEERFRFELLNQIDEIVFFDPLLEQQLEKFYRCRIRMEEVLEQKLDLVTLHQVLCWKLDVSANASEKEKFFRIAVNCIAQKIRRSWGIYSGACKRKLSQI